MVSVEEIFAKAGLVPSDVQLAYAKRVLEAIHCSASSKGGDVLIEAETGVGKTLGYLVPAMIMAATSGGRVVVSTYTKALQRQVISDAARVAAAVELVLGRPIRVAPLVGKNNFFDPDKVDGFIDILSGEDVDENVMQEWLDLRDWLRSPGCNGEIQSFLDECGNLPAGINPLLVCLDSSSSDEAQKKYREHAALSKHANVLVTNHTLLCLASLGRTDILLREDDSRPLIACIVDEADRLPEAARSIMTEQAPLVSMAKVARKLAPHLPADKAETLLVACEELLEKAAAIGATGIYGSAVLIDNMSRRDQEMIKEASREASASICAVQAELKNLRKNPDLFLLVHDLQRYHGVLANIAAYSKDEGGGRSGDNIGSLQFSPSRKYPSLGMVRLFPARIVSNTLNHIRNNSTSRVADNGEAQKPTSFSGTALILTSATLSGASDSRRFREIQIQLGIYDRTNPCAHLHASFSPKKFGSIRQIVLADPSIPKPFAGMDEDSDEVRLSEEWLDYVSGMVERAARAGGYVLALTTSYRTAALIEIRLRQKDLGVPIVSKSRSQHIDSAIREMKNSPGGVLLTPTGWEGLDAKSYGFSWQSVVICQLPIVRSDSAYKQALLRHLIDKKSMTPAEAEASVYGEIMSVAVRKMRQGIGRGIRDKNDEFTLWIGDPRFPLPDRLIEESEHPIPRAANRTLPHFKRCIPARFANVPVAVLMKDGSMPVA